jgi:hypothetical protein
VIILFIWASNIVNVYNEMISMGNEMNLSGMIERLRLKLKTKLLKIITKTSIYSLNPTNYNKLSTLFTLFNII